MPKHAQDLFFLFLTPDNSLYHFQSLCWELLSLLTQVSLTSSRSLTCGCQPISSSRILPVQPGGNNSCVCEAWLEHEFKQLTHFPVCLCLSKITFLQSMINHWVKRQKDLAFENMAGLPVLLFNPSVDRAGFLSCIRIEEAEKNPHFHVIQFSNPYLPMQIFIIKVIKYPQAQVRDILCISVLPTKGNCGSS